MTQALFSMTLTTRTVELLLRRDPAEARRQVSLLKELQRDALAEMRALIFALRPGSLEKDGLLQALRTYAAAVEQRTGLGVSVESSIDERLSPDLEDVLFRVGQEALHNVVKHAAASSVQMRLGQAGEQVVLSVSDDGVGFDEASVPSGHLGVAGMRARLGLIGGDVRIDSVDGQGTTIEVRAPYRPSQPAAGTEPTAPA
ncbi:MAG: sensor histidine kinase [Chloroflexota bacterium]|nr:sensor histidine kinase [Chloroflexota bacterium]